MTITITRFGNNLTPDIIEVGAGTSVHWQSDFIGPLEPGSFIQVAQYTNVECTNLMYSERHPVDTTSGDVTLQVDPTVEHQYGYYLPLTNYTIQLRIELHGPSGQVDFGVLETPWASYEGQTTQIIRVIDGLSTRIQQVIDAVYVHIDVP